MSAPFEKGRKMAKYRKKPVTVEAEQWNPKMGDYPGQGIPDDLGVIWQFDFEGHVSNGIVITIHGQKTNVAIGDWVIKEPDGIHNYPCKPDIFEATYEKV